MLEKIIQSVQLTCNCGSVRVQLLHDSRGLTVQGQVDFKIPAHRTAENLWIRISKTRLNMTLREKVTPPPTETTDRICHKAFIKH